MIALDIVNDKLPIAKFNYNNSDNLMLKIDHMKIVMFLIVTSFMAVGIISSIGIFPVIVMEVSLLILCAAGTIGYVVFADKRLTLPQTSPVIIFFVLFIYTIITSKYATASIIFAYFLLASSLLYVSLIASFIVSSTPPGTSTQKQPVIDSAKIAFIGCASVHALCSILFYLFQPVRTAGLLDDFSQASMLLLLAFGLAFPLYKHKSFFTAFSLLLFCAFFTSFSRTANALLIFLFIALFIQAKTTIERRLVLKTSLVALVALLIVYVYPSMLGENVVDRGGVAHLSTLNSRTIYWQSAWEAIQLKPFIGHGLGTFAWTGIQEKVPFNTILFVHNDYLQIWHDLGFFWFAAFVSALAYVLLKYSPFKLKLKPKLNLSFTIMNNQTFISWSLLVLIALYMSINFLILSIEFHVAIAILLADLQRNEFT